MGGLEGPPKPPDARQRPGDAVALLDPLTLGSVPANRCAYAAFSRGMMEISPLRSTTAYFT
jgi:hypothetical protein